MAGKFPSLRFARSARARGGDTRRESVRVRGVETRARMLFVLNLRGCEAARSLLPGLRSKQWPTERAPAVYMRNPVNSPAWRILVSTAARRALLSGVKNGAGASEETEAPERVAAGARATRAEGAMNEVVAPAVTFTRLGSSSPDRTTAADDDDWLERVSAAAAVGTSRSSIIGRDDDDGGGSRPARLAVLVPFREDEDGTRGPQLTRLLRRLRDVFRGVAPVAVCVAEQSSDGRRFNRGHALNAAFLHLRRNRPGWWDARTLWCFHDCDMLPDPSLAAHYLRREDDDDDDDDDDESPRERRNHRCPRRRGFVRVLEAGGCRYDADGCFGGVTVYDERGFIATNGYPNGFWGWGGEDNAQFLRCVAARLRLERVKGCDFEDLEQGTETVAAKLAALDEKRARCPAKEKRRLLRRNAAGDGWRRDGLVDSRYEIVEERALRVDDDDDDEMDDFRGVRVVVKLLSGIEDELVCVQCGVSKGPNGFAAHQYRSAAFWAKKTGAASDAGRGSLETLNPTLNHACHWDDERGVGVNARASSPTRARGLGDFRNTKRGARCLECVAADPKVLKDAAARRANATDATRTTCAICAARFAARNALFKHLRESGHGEMAETAEREVAKREAAEAPSRLLDPRDC